MTVGYITWRIFLSFRKPKVIESQLPDELDIEEDDIVTDASPPIPQHALFSAPQGQSQPVGKVFVERNSKYQNVRRRGLFNGRV